MSGSVNFLALFLGRFLTCGAGAFLAALTGCFFLAGAFFLTVMFTSYHVGVCFTLMGREPVHAHVHVHIEQDSRVLDVLTRIERKLDEVHQFERTQMADLSAVQAEISENGDVVNSAVTLLQNLSQLVREAAGDPAAIQALADQLDAQTQALAQAVAANTPAEG
jgi:predicted phage tail protein